MTKRSGDDDLYVTQIELDHGIYTGVRLTAVGNDIVPLQEEQEARLEYKITLDDWGRMDYREKALMIAVRRNRTAIQNIQTEAEINKTEQMTRNVRKR